MSDNRMSKRINHSKEISSELFANGDSHRFRFKNPDYAITTFMILMFRFHYIGDWIVFSSLTVNIVHILVTSAFVFLPVMYMFLFIRQYSRLGCQAISRLMPVTCGVGYTMIIISVIELVHDVAVVADALEFFYVAIKSKMPWLYCKPEWQKGCVDINNLAECKATNCFKHVSQLSAFRYRIYETRQFFGDNSSNNVSETRFWKNIQGSRVIFLLVCIIIILLICDLNISANNKLSDIVVVMYVVAMALFIIILALNEDSSDGIMDVFQVTTARLIDYKSWVLAVLYLLESVQLADVSTILMGSYLPKTAVTDLQAFLMWLGLSILIIISELLACIMRAALTHKLGSKGNVWNISSLRGVVTMALYPQILGYSNRYASALTYLYFALIFLSTLIRIRLLLACIYNTMADYKPIIRAYKFYIRVFSCCLLFILTFPIYIVGMFHTFLSLLRVLVQCLSFVVLGLVTVTVLYIYGVQRLCDDHHFTFGKQPAVYFKATLGIAPIVFVLVGGIFYKLIFAHFLESPDGGKLFLTLFPLSLLPQVIGFLFITTYYLKRQNMAHLFRCEENWGDPSSNTRKERIIYQPRLQTNYFRRIDVCKHDCLRYNKLVPVVIKDEGIYQKDAYNRLNPSRHSFGSISES